MHIGNKLKTKHIQWQKHKMNVSIAAQTLSASVSSAITFLRSLQVPEFQDSKATSDFVLLINNICDILNSKSKFGKKYKAPITKQNYATVTTHLTEAIEILTSLQDLNGLKLVAGPRKTFIQGFVISARSILAISKDLLFRENSQYEFVLTFRFSQDPLEMFFSKVRGRLGWNNNPNALQFKYALRSLLLKNKIESPSTANCIETKDDCDDKSSSHDVSDKEEQQMSTMLLTSTTWRSDVIFYISGYIAFKLLKILKCPECASALHEPAPPNDTAGHCPSLLTCKSYGKLCTPSSSVVVVITLTDRLARQELCRWTSIDKKSITKITYNVVKETKASTFHDLYEHSMQCHVLDENMIDDHITSLIKLITKKYLHLFMYQFSKVYTERIIKENKASLRHQLTKQILFNE